MNNGKISNKGMFIALCVMGFIIIVMFALIINLYLGKESNNDKKTSKTTTTEVIKASESENVIKDQELGDFGFTNTSLLYQNNTSTFSATVTNNGSTSAPINEFKIHVYDKKGEEIITLVGYVGSTLEPGASTQIASSYGEDLTTVADKVVYEVVK